MLWAVLRKIFGLELRPDPSEAWLMVGRAPGTCSREPPPLEPRDDIEPANDNDSVTHLDLADYIQHNQRQKFSF